MNSTKLLAGLLIGLFLLILGVWLLSGPHESASYVEISDNRIEVQVAETIEQQIQGLSGRESLASDEGMLFVYDEPRFHSFWMKDMNFPIDIIWIGDEQTVVDITADLSPDTYPQRFTSIRPSQYVLEVNAGFAQDKGVVVGDEVIINLD